MSFLPASSLVTFLALGPRSTEHDLMISLRNPLYYKMLLAVLERADRLVANIAPSGVGRLDRSDILRTSAVTAWQNGYVIWRLMLYFHFLISDECLIWSSIFASSICLKRGSDRVSATFRFGVTIAEAASRHLLYSSLWEHFYCRSILLYIYCIGTIKSIMLLLVESKTIIAIIEYSLYAAFGHL